MPTSRWGPLDDVVMGGVSLSAISEQPGAGEGGAPASVFRWGVQGPGGSGLKLRLWLRLTLNLGFDEHWLP